MNTYLGSFKYLPLMCFKYSCLWLKISLGKYNSTKFKFLLCDLLMVIANETITENYRLTNLNGHGDCEGDIDILGIYVIFPSIFFSKMILASIIWFDSLITINLVLLHNPSDWFKFRSNIIIVPIFNFIEWFGKSKVFKQLKNSGVRCPKASNH